MGTSQKIRQITTFSGYNDEIFCPEESNSIHLTSYFHIAHFERVNWLPNMLGHPAVEDHPIFEEKMTSAIGSYW